VHLCHICATTTGSIIKKLGTRHNILDRPPGIYCINKNGRDYVNGTDLGPRTLRPPFRQPYIHPATSMEAEPSKRASNRIKYLGALAGGLSKPAAAKKFGISGATGRRVVARACQGRVTDLPRTGRPPRFTAQLLDTATEILTEDESRLFTTPGIIGVLRDLGLLEGPVKPEAFLKAWKMHTKASGMQLDSKSTGSKFLITNQDTKDREEFAHEMLQLLGKDGIRRCIFIDETTLEEYPHPKAGKSCTTPCCMHTHMRVTTHASAYAYAGGRGVGVGCGEGEP
jgi:transposase